MAISMSWCASFVTLAFICLSSYSAAQSNRSNVRKLGEATPV